MAEPFIFGMFRKCLADIKKAREEGKTEEEATAIVAAPILLGLDFILLPVEILATLAEKLKEK